MYSGGRGGFRGFPPEKKRKSVHLGVQLGVHLGVSSNSPPGFTSFSLLGSPTPQHILVLTVISRSRFLKNDGLQARLINNYR